MPKSDGYKEFVMDQLADLNGLTCRAMFGGYGLARYGSFFGIIHKGRLYFKTGPATAPLYRAQQIPFKPNPKQTLRNYYEVPVDIVESSDRLVEWAVAAARR
jgi:DNA transformation protein